MVLLFRGYRTAAAAQAINKGHKANDVEGGTSYKTRLRQVPAKPCFILRSLALCLSLFLALCPSTSRMH